MRHLNYKHKSVRLCVNPFIRSESRMHVCSDNSNGIFHTNNILFRMFSTNTWCELWRASKKEGRYMLPRCLGCSSWCVWGVVEGAQRPGQVGAGSAWVWAAGRACIAPRPPPCPHSPRRSPAPCHPLRHSRTRCCCGYCWNGQHTNMYYIPSYIIEWPQKTDFKNSFIISDFPEQFLISIHPGNCYF